MKYKVSKKRRCRMCDDKPALYFVKGKAKSRSDHDLCPKCYRKLRESVKQRAIQNQ